MFQRTTAAIIICVVGALAGGCGETHYTLAGVEDCVQQQGATGVSSTAPDYQGDPDAAVIGDWMGLLGEVTGRIDGHGFSVSVTDSRAYASPSTPAGAASIEPIAPCVTAIDASGG